MFSRNLIRILGMGMLGLGLCGAPDSLRAGEAAGLEAGAYPNHLPTGTSLNGALPDQAICLPIRSNPLGCEGCSGIRTESLRVSAGGFMLDYRYSITDPEVAAGWLGEMPPPFIEVPETGQRLMVPASAKLGPLSQRQRPGTEPRVGAVRFTMFANPGGIVKPGQIVKLYFGEHQEWVVVQ